MTALSDFKPRWIRHIATSRLGSIVLAAEFKGLVHVWDIDSRRVTGRFDTTLDWGGRRLAISGDSRACVVGAYNRFGISRYGLPVGVLTWTRRDLKKVQNVSLSHDSQRVLCGLEGRPFHILDAESGETVEKLPGVRKLWESRYDDVRLECGLSVKLRSGGRLTLPFGRERFELLAADFGEGCIGISAAGGPVHCQSAESGRPMWQYALKRAHCLSMSYVENDHSFLTLWWDYDRGGPKVLIRLDARSGRDTHICDIGDVWGHEFCFGGRFLVTSAGDVVSTSSGKCEFSFPLP